MAKRWYKHLSFDQSDPNIDPMKLWYSSNSTVDNCRTDMAFTDALSRQELHGIKSRILPYFRPSSAPIKMFQTDTFNKPVCTLSAQAERTEIESFDGRDISADELKANCDYLLAGNCRGK